MTALEGWEEGGLPEGLFSDEQSFFTRNLGLMFR